MRRVSSLNPQERVLWPQKHLVDRMQDMIEGLAVEAQYDPLAPASVHST